MKLLLRVLDRALPALLMASSVVLLSAGLFSFAPVAPADHGSPSAPTAASPTPTATVAPSAAPSLSLPTVAPSATPTVQTTFSASPSISPGDTPTTTLPPVASAMATRIVVPSLGIDLPVVSGELQVAGNRDDFPLCDVAQYLVEYSQPGQPGTTYLYAHARTGMFLPLLEQSQRNDGRGMIGALVEVYTADSRLHLYEIYVVKRHATNLALAHELPPEGHQVIMQTSEGPRGTVPKLQVAARPLGVVDADPREANPPPAPRACS